MPVESNTIQCTNTVFMVRPSAFGYNKETAISNTFQVHLQEKEKTIQQKVWAEFDAFVSSLTTKGIQVHVFNDTAIPPKPDAIFPNNWISLHANGTMILYPMLAPNRRHERKDDIIAFLKENYEVNKQLDLTLHEKDNRFLEGTGSIVFDHKHRIAYAALSPRTDKELFLSVCDYLKYKPICFHAFDKNGIAIYHTNVMMCIGTQFSVVCLNSIVNEIKRAELVSQLSETGHTIINISFEQMNHFAGNMLALQTLKNKEVLVLSQRAFDSLTTIQKKEIETHIDLLPVSIPTIETIGGGSARCMMTEVFLPRKIK